jgi:molecular chaperone Hsp33
LFEGAPVRGELVHLDATWRAVLERHEYPEPLRLVLGEMMAAAALLSATLKFDGSLIMQIQGSGAARLIVVEITSDQTMRATAKWEGDLAAQSFRELVGDGRFVITIAPREAAQQTYQGIVALEGDSVAAVLEHYMSRSEQLETRLWLASDVAHAAGMMLQRLPGESGIDPDAWNRAVRLGETVTPHELLGLPARQIIRRLYHEEDIRVFDARLVSFRCSCTRERVVNMLRLLGRAEVKSILAERGRVDVNCEFCNRHYSLDRVDAEQIFAADVVTPAGATRH